MDSNKKKQQEAEGLEAKKKSVVFSSLFFR